MTLVTLRQPIGLMTGRDLREVMHFSGEIINMGHGDRTYKIHSIRLPYGQTTIEQVFPDVAAAPVVTINEAIIASTQEI